MHWETINCLYKAELIRRRLLELIGNLPPAEAETNYYRQLAN